MKPAKTFEQQVDWLIQEHGLLVPDKNKAVEALKRINYYHYRGYYIHWMDKQQQTFLPGITFDMICSLQDFDQKLRISVFSYLQKVELAVRTAVAYHLANTYGPMSHLDEQLYENKQHFDNYKKTLEDSVRDSNELFIKHHNNDYTCTPIWAAIEVISFGTLSKMYRNLNNNIRQDIAKAFFGIDEELLTSYLHALSFLRNVCAHCGRIYNRRLSINIKINKGYNPHIISLANKGFMLFPNSFFSYYLGMKDLLNSTEHKDLADSIDALFGEYSAIININHMGFPQNWKEF